MRPDSAQGEKDRVLLISHFLLRGQRVQQGKQQWHTQLQSRTPTLKPSAQRGIEWNWGENRHPDIVQNHTLFTVESRLQNSCLFNICMYALADRLWEVYRTTHWEAMCAALTVEGVQYFECLEHLVTQYLEGQSTTYQRLSLLLARALDAVDEQPHLLPLLTVQGCGQIRRQAALFHPLPKHGFISRPGRSRFDIHRGFHPPVLAKRSRHVLTPTQAAS